MDLGQELYRRGQANGWKMSELTAQAQAHLVERYGIELSIESFLDPRGLIISDLSGRTVAVYEVGTVDGYTRSETQKFTDVLVLVEDGLVLGWVAEGQVLDIGQPFFSLNVKAFNPMPKVFDFLQPCPHVAVYGGWWDHEANGWECFGCSRVVFDYQTGAKKSPRLS